MTKEEAREELEAMLVGLQKTRSVILEAGYPESFLASNFPWTWGDKCPLKLLARMLDSGFTRMEWFNMRFIFYRFLPETLLETTQYYQGKTDKPFPIEPPDLQAMAEWEED